MQRDKELLAFAQVTAMPRLTFLRRRMDAGQRRGDSPLVERLSLHLARQGLALQTWQDPREQMAIAPMPVSRPSPSAPDALPTRLSASAAEALRACPYRFFARHVLHAREDDELADDLEKRDYGTWLHDVLHVFHAGRTAPDAASNEAARLQAIGRERQTQLGLPDDQFMPFEASFKAFVPRYIAWLHERDGLGARWLQGERRVAFRPEALGGTLLEGIIDRIDEVRTEAGAALELIDYKTGSADGLRQQVRQPFEDTQLAFYAALMRSETAQALQAIYLALDGTQGLVSLAHAQVERSAQALLAGLAHDLQRLRAGAGMTALGEGRTCTYCEARGLCRRDHWAAEATR
jgi:ATP-dependent helicase/nuclease subunit B